MLKALIRPSGTFPQWGKGERALRWLASVVIAAAVATPAAAQMAAPLASPAFDASVYNDDAVQRTNKVFGNWTLVCSDVGALHQRFCNIVTKAEDKTGRFFLAMIVSTTDQGKPAALLRMPLFVSLRDGVEVNPPKVGKKPGRKVSILSCAPEACTSVLPLQLNDIQNLASKGKMRFRLRLFQPEMQTASIAKPIDVIFDGTGFSEALKASQSP